VYGEESGADIVKFIKSRRIAWLGHVMQMDDKREPKRILEWKPIGTRIRGRPRKRWILDVEEDMQIMGIRRWRKQCKNEQNGRESLRRLKPIVPCNANKRRRRWEKWHWDGDFFRGFRVFLVSIVPTVISTYYTDRLLSPLNLLLRTYMGRSSLVWEITQRRLVCLSTFRYILPVPS
jgi:hypothetical protein